MQRGYSSQNILASHKYVHYFPSLDMNDEEKKVINVCFKKKLYSIYYHGCQVFFESLLRDIDMK